MLMEILKETNLLPQLWRFLSSFASWSRRGSKDDRIREKVCHKQAASLIEKHSRAFLIGR